MNQPIELSLEQQFSIRSFKERVKLLTYEETQKLVVDLYEQSVIREALYRSLMRHHWGLSSPMTINQSEG